MTSDPTDTPGPFLDSTGRYGGSSPDGLRDDVEFRLMRTLSLAARRWGAHVEQQMLAATGQSRPRWQTLYVLSAAEAPVTTSILSDRLAIKWPPLIRTLNGLETDGLIRRLENPNDRRSRYIEITASGLEVVDKVRPALQSVRSLVLNQLDETDMRLAIATLEAILKGVQAATTAAKR